MTSKLQGLTDLWQEFDLPGTQRLLDDLATQITTRQDESDASRKQLIELIRGFKKSNTEETRQVVAPLLKNFQNEIDSLSKRSKAAEKSFFDIYKKFCDITDPVPTLEYCMESMKGLQKLQDLEIETAQLRETLGEYNLEMAELRSTAKKVTEMEEKVEEQENSMEEAIDLEIKSKEEALVKLFEEKSSKLEEEKARSEQKLVEAELKAKSLQSLLDESQNELFEVRSRQERTSSAITDDMELLMTDLDRANQRAATAEKEAAMLQERLQEMSTHERGEQGSSEDVGEGLALKAQLAAKEAEVATLVVDLQKATKATAEEEGRRLKREVELETSLASTIQERDQLASKLAMQADYEGVKKDLNILKTLEFPSVQSEDDARPLEVLILERSKALQAENSMLRLDKERLVREVNTTKAELEDSAAKSESQGKLIIQLEDHVEQLQAISTPYREEAEGRCSSDMLAEALKVDSHTVENVFERSGSLSPSSLTSPNETGEAAALLPIVQAQRERLRLRNEELETVGLEQQQQLSVLSRQVGDLQADNLKLYEKIRFLQACGGGSRRSEVVVPVENRYQESYEQKLDPFSNFSKQEKQRKYGQLSVFEKVILSLVRFIVSNKTARLVVFFYSVLLHGLVFAVLYKLVLTESCRHDMAAQWHEKYVEHMESVHNGKEHAG